MAPNDRLALIPLPPPPPPIGADLLSFNRLSREL